MAASKCLGLSSLGWQRHQWHHGCRKDYLHDCSCNLRATKRSSAHHHSSRNGPCQYAHQSFPLTSGSGQAVAVIAILIPLADVGVTRQTTVLAFNFGDGFCNFILPTSTALMGTPERDPILFLMTGGCASMWKLFFLI